MDGYEHAWQAGEQGTPQFDILPAWLRESRRAPRSIFSWECARDFPPKTSGSATVLLLLLCLYQHQNKNKKQHHSSHFLQDQLHYTFSSYFYNQTRPGWHHRISSARVSFDILLLFVYGEQGGTLTASIMQSWSIFKRLVSYTLHYLSPSGKMTSYRTKSCYYVILFNNWDGQTVLPEL